MKRRVVAVLVVAAMVAIMARAEDDDAGQCDGTRRRTVRRSEHAARDRDALDLARFGSLRPAGRLPATERHCAASLTIVGELDS
jgi:hypothetical protein